MDTSNFSKNPPRLVDEGGTVGRLLESADAAFQSGLSPQRSWEKLEERFDARVRRPYALRLLPLGLGFAAVAAAAVLEFRPRPAPAPLALTAEPVATVVPVAPSVAPEPSAPAVAPEHAPRRGPVSSFARPANFEPAPTPPSSNTSCLALVASKPERAVDCYLSLASGGGVQADVALYEALRVSAGELHDPVRALTLADQYRSRFPDGAMRGEVAWLRVQSLDRAGRSDEALSESEALLGTPIGRALAPKLHFLRGHIYSAERGDCARAASEYLALVGAPGADADAAELERASCLERLGQSADAASAYRQYLKRSDARDAARARGRLDALTAAPATPEGVAP